MKNDKSPGNDGLTKEFYVTFWDYIKATFISSFKQAKERKELSISQKQAIIRLIEKKNRNKRYIKNWRPISLLNVHMILKNQESCVINGGTTTKSFKLNRGARQGDPISAYLFILAFEILFLLIKENPHIKG